MNKPLLLHGQKHIGLVFKSIAGDGAHSAQNITGEGTQSGLGVGDPHTHEETKHTAGEVVTEFASCRYMGQREITAAQHNAAGFCHFLHTGFGVFGVVLVITVHGNNAQGIGPVLKEPVKSILQRGTFTLVDFVMKQMDLGMRGGGFKIMHVFRLAAVID